MIITLLGNKKVKDCSIRQLKLIAIFNAIQLGTRMLPTHYYIIYLRFYTDFLDVKNN